MPIRRQSAFAVACLLASGCAHSPHSAEPASAQPDFLAANVDSTVAPGQDFFAFATGAWMKRNPIPAAAGSWDIGSLLDEELRQRQRQVSERAAASKAPKGSPEQLVGDFWWSAMDTATIEREGLNLLREDLQRIDRIASRDDLVDMVAELHNRNINGSPFASVLTSDDERAGQWAFAVNRGNYGLPAPVYFTATDQQSGIVRVAYRTYMFETLKQLGLDSSTARTRADALYALEEALSAGGAVPFSTRRIAKAELERLAPNFNWQRFWQGVGFRADSMFLWRPTFFETFNRELAARPLEAFKDQLRFRVIAINAPFLDARSRALAFAFAQTLNGRREPIERVRSVLEWQSRTVSDAVSQLLVKEFFTAQQSRRYNEVFASMRGALRTRLQQAGWMQEGTRIAAVRKLDAMQVGLGHPDKWADLSALDIRRDAWVHNITRANRWSRTRFMSYLVTPPDPKAWSLSESMRSSEYHRDRNVITIEPFAFRVPGVPDAALDDAFVYGYTFIGHEISHGFDSEGRLQDERGVRRNWFADSAEYARRVRPLVTQFSAYEPLPGQKVNGQRTLAENIADLVGLRIALDAFKGTEQYRSGKEVAGYTPLQRFFLAYATRHLGHQRPASLASQLVNDSHAPNPERVNGTVVHMPEFYDAFGVKPGDRMFVPEGSRTRVW